MKDKLAILQEGYDERLRMWKKEWGLHLYKEKGTIEKMRMTAEECVKSMSNIKTLIGRESNQDDVETIPLKIIDGEE